VDTITVTGTLDDLSDLMKELAADDRYIVTGPQRLKGDLLARQYHGQLELLSIAIGLGSSLVASALYDQIKTLVVSLRKRGNKTLRIDGEDDNPPTDDAT